MGSVVRPEVEAGNNSMLNDLRPPGLGSYAVLMPQSVWVSGNCEVDKEFWKFAGKTAKNVHRCVDKKSPTAATITWQVMSGKAKCRFMRCPTALLRNVVGLYKSQRAAFVTNLFGAVFYGLLCFAQWHFLCV